MIRKREILYDNNNNRNREGGAEWSILIDDYRKKQITN